MHEFSFSNKYPSLIILSRRLPIFLLVLLIFDVGGMVSSNIPHVTRLCTNLVETKKMMGNIMMGFIGWQKGNGFLFCAQSFLKKRNSLFRSYLGRKMLANRTSQIAISKGEENFYDFWIFFAIRVIFWDF